MHDEVQPVVGPAQYAFTSKSGELNSRPELLAWAS